MDDVEMTAERPVCYRELPARGYTDPERFRLELERLFCRHWLLAAALGEVPAVGARAVTVAGRPLILTRVDDRVGAFHNVCSHRGSAVVEGCSEGERLRCGYHGWTYGLDGRLVAVPGESRFAGLDKEACSLPGVAVQVWGGLVWVHLGDATRPLRDWLGSWEGELGRYRTEGQVGFEQRVDQVALNWKACVDAFNETYHVPHIHPKTVGRLVEGKASWFRYAGVHSRMVIPVRRSLHQAQGQRTGPSPKRDHGKDLLPEQARDHCNYTIFPNLIFNFLPTWGIVLVFEPLAVDRTEIRSRMLADPPASERHTAGLEAQWREFSNVMDEDVEALNRIGRGLASPAFVTVRLGGEEERLIHYHDMVEESLR